MKFIKYTEKVMIDILQERKRQLEKWGVQNHSNCVWVTILMEEIGEMAKSILEKDGYNILREEIIQVATVAMAFVESLDRWEDI